MSDPSVNVDVEDVLSSIRRLVSETDHSLRPAPKPDPETVRPAAEQSEEPQKKEAGEMGALILTSAFRVTDPTPEVEDTVEEVEPDTDAPAMQAELSNLRSAVTDQIAEDAETVEQETVTEVANLELAEAEVVSEPAEAWQIDVPEEEYYEDQDEMISPEFRHVEVRPSSTVEEDEPDEAELEAWSEGQPTAAELAQYSGDVIEAEAETLDVETTIDEEPTATPEEYSPVEEAETDLVAEEDAPAVDILVEEDASLNAHDDADIEEVESAELTSEDASPAEDEHPISENQPDLADIEDDDETQPEIADSEHVDEVEETLVVLASAPIEEAHSELTDAVVEAAQLGEFDESVVDEDVLRDLVADIVRQELSGVLGERITRNVRKLVRREIHRAMLTRDVD